MTQHSLEEGKEEEVIHKQTNKGTLTLLTLKIQNKHLEQNVYICKCQLV